LRYNDKQRIENRRDTALQFSSRLAAVVEPSVSDFAAAARLTLVIGLARRPVRGEKRRHELFRVCPLESPTRH